MGTQYKVRQVEQAREENRNFSVYIYPGRYGPAGRPKTKYYSCWDQDQYRNLEEKKDKTGDPVNPWR